MVVIHTFYDVVEDDMLIMQSAGGRGHLVDSESTTIATRRDTAGLDRVTGGW